MKNQTLLAGCVLLLAVLAAGADWPQWRGPNRDNLSTETGLLKKWPESGPKLLWINEHAGIGYSGPAIVGDRPGTSESQPGGTKSQSGPQPSRSESQPSRYGLQPATDANRLYTMGGDEKNDLVLAFDCRTGKQLWSRPIGPYVRNGYGSGPRGTPTVDGAYLYALSASGQLACLKTSDGNKVWTVSMTGAQGLGGGKPYWNYSESPLVDGDQVVCTPGGSQGTLAALDKKTGNVLWRSKEITDNAAYSSIVPTTVGGVRQYAQLTMKGVAGVAAKDGRLLWYYPNKKYRTAVIPTPIVYDNYVYAAAGYGAGDVLLKLTPDGDGTKAEQVYDEDAMRLMNNKHEGVVRVGDYVYGWSDNGGWTCQEFKTGKKMWQSKKLGKGSLTAADGQLYCYSEDDGTVALVNSSPDGWQEQGRFTLPRKTKRREYRNNIWTHPVIAYGRLYLRDQELLFCFDIKDGGREIR